MSAAADYDGIIIGAGQQGLVLAAYLSRAGLRVAVFERRPEEGGASVRFPIRFAACAGGARPPRVWKSRPALSPLPDPPAT